jgi:outer membrane immunogenic protein
MTTPLRTALAALLILTGGAAMAADLSSGKQLPPAPALPSFYSWTGFYLGAQGGYSWGSDKIRQLSTTGLGYAGAFRDTPGSALGGGQAGLNVQFDSIVLGLEGDLEALQERGGFSLGRSQRDWQASLRGRIGYAFDTVMIYGTGGAAFTEFNLRSYDPISGLGGSTQVSRAGWTLGGGVNYALTSNLILGAEYRYTDYGKFDPTARNSALGLAGEQEAKTHTVRASLAYKF